MCWNLIQDTVRINYLSDFPSLPLRICCGSGRDRVSVSGSDGDSVVFRIDDRISIVT